MEQAVQRSVLWGRFALLLITFLVIAPVLPVMPESGLDASWMFGMNEAVSRGFIFGRDIVFTFGPYSAIYTNTYHPATYSLALAGAAALSVSYFLCLSQLLGEGWGKRQLAVFLFLGLVCSKDAILFFLPLLVGMAVGTGASAEPQVDRQERLPIIALIFAPLGLLPLIKVSLIPLCAVVIGLCFVYLLHSKKKSQAIVCVLAPCISLLFLWVLSGQPVGALMDYFTSMLPVVLGYSDAMSIEGSFLEIGIYLLGALLLSLVLIREFWARGAQGLFVFCIFGVQLLLAFKASFVRHDYRHTAFGFSLLLILTLFLYASRAVSAEGKRGLYPLALVLGIVVTLPFSWYGLKRNLSHDVLQQELASAGIDLEELNGKSDYEKVRSVLSALDVPKAFNIITRSISTRHFDALTMGFSSAWSQAISTINEDCKLKFALAGTVDLYHARQSCAIARGYDWHPRPTLQSYTAYTRGLAYLNEQHVRKASAPDHIIIGLSNIDNRYPAMSDGMSMAALLDNYSLATLENDWVLLNRKESLVGTSNTSLVEQGGFQLGEAVSIPLGESPIFATVEMEKTILGAILSALFKPSQLRMHVVLAGGEEHTYRVVPGFMEGGFMISPLVLDAPGLAMMMESPPRIIPARRVAAIVLSEQPGLFKFWKTEYHLEVRRYSYPR